MFVPVPAGPPLPPLTKGEKIAMVTTISGSLALSAMVYGIAVALGLILLLTGHLPPIGLVAMNLGTLGTSFVLSSAAFLGLVSYINCRCKSRAALMTPPPGGAP